MNPEFGSAKGRVSLMSSSAFVGVSAAFDGCAESAGEDDDDDNEVGSDVAEVERRYAISIAVERDFPIALDSD